jgi:hypothetical protein
MKDGQTIGQWLKWDFKSNGDLRIKDKNGNLIYFENAGGWDRREYNSEKKLIYFENSEGRWRMLEYDSDGNLIYDECSEGIIVDNRIPEIIEHNGRKYQLIPNQNPQP